MHSETYTTFTMCEKNTCKWLVLGKTTLCCRRCIGKYCFAHLARLRNGGGTRPCSECGKGVKTLISLCEGCGYYNAKLRQWRGGLQRDFTKEWKRLCSISVE